VLPWHAADVGVETEYQPMRAEHLQSGGDNRSPSTRDGQATARASNRRGCEGGSRERPGVTPSVRSRTCHPPITDFRRPAPACTRSQWETQHAGRVPAGDVKATCWPGRTRTGALRFRKPLLCLLSYEPMEAPAGLEPASHRNAHRFAGGYLTARSRDHRCPRPDSNGRPAPSGGAALSNCATRTGVAEPGVEPGMPGATDLQAAERSVAHFRRGGRRDSNPQRPGSQPGSSAFRFILSRSARTRTCGLPDVDRLLSPLSY
jgi:hypothetical protein